ncbi:MAG: class B sortase [Ruminococcaceae bacterium]|nr:class B sortase [Oscillospiraceae bacterium]
MKNNDKDKKTNLHRSKVKTPILICVLVILALILIGLVAALVVHSNKQPESVSTPTPTITQPTPPPTVLPTIEPQDPEPTVRQPIDWMVDLYEQNPDIAYWMKINGTKLDYPVMYTPDEPERYLYKNFDGKFAAGGVPFMEDACSIDPESTNLIVYGHNMVDGSQFRTMFSYKDKEFWEEHPQISLTSMYEERTFDIMAVFYDRVYYQSQTDVFKFYKFIDPETEEEFNEGIEYFKENSLYDTGVTAEFGDQLLTLCTCSYHTPLGRLVIVAREVVEESGS